MVQMLTLFFYRDVSRIRPRHCMASYTITSPSWVTTPNNILSITPVGHVSQLTLVFNGYFRYMIPLLPLAQEYVVQIMDIAIIG